MSVLSQKSVQCFVAPISIGAETILICGSWLRSHPGNLEEWRIGSQRLCHYRIHCWKQQIKREIVKACLDWSVQKRQDGLRFEIEIKFATHFDCADLLDSLSNHIHDLLNASRVRLLSKVFQQEQPGASFVVSVMGNAGNEGDNQSV